MKGVFNRLLISRYCSLRRHLRTLFFLLLLSFCFDRSTSQSCFMDIMDPTEKNSPSENKKLCTDCKTTKTPLWRGGPAGPKSLCNACGIRYRKKRRTMMGLNKGLEKKRKKEISDSSHISSNANTNDDDDDKKLNGSFNGLSKSVKVIICLGSEVLLQSSSSLSGVVKKQRCQRRRKLREVEQAAISLMALSCGSVFA
ncbi:GATA transcription factor 23 [Hibiscus syriacus]|uniref:GATA transcription factor 23 n=1 Tax=Hibiscus syriacus TaxID=106335 RepID=A0A6A3ATK5_HIBSY|nr:GATA transcription factor 15-like [Hibiscus syriacus]KAE8706435.1 GATA transcription factor 23 [Hibiscus syriacus]